MFTPHQTLALSVLKPSLVTSLQSAVGANVQRFCDTSRIKQLLDQVTLASARQNRIVLQSGIKWAYYTDSYTDVE